MFALRRKGGGVAGIVGPNGAAHTADVTVEQRGPIKRLLQTLDAGDVPLCTDTCKT